MMESLFFLYQREGKRYQRVSNRKSSKESVRSTHRLHAPHLYRFNSKCSIISIIRPSRIPRILCPSKIAHGSQRPIIPRFITFIIREPSRRASYSQIDDQVEALIKRRTWTSIHPRVFDDYSTASILRRLREPSAIPKSLASLSLDIHLQNRLDPRIDIKPHKSVVPFDSICMEPLVEGTSL